jgi:hypothetical protein
MSLSLVLTLALVGGAVAARLLVGALACALPTRRRSPEGTRAYMARPNGCGPHRAFPSTVGSGAFLSCLALAEPWQAHRARCRQPARGSFCAASHCWARPISRWPRRARGSHGLTGTGSRRRTAGALRQTKNVAPRGRVPLRPKRRSYPTSPPMRPRPAPGWPWRRPAQGGSSRWCALLQRGASADLRNEQG